MRINHNIAALNTYNKLSSASAAQNKSMEKLSSGLRINSAADDAAGLAISEKMRGQIRGLDQATRNSQDGISLIQTAEGALSETTDILQRMRELAVQSSNDTNTEDDRAEIQKEVSQLQKEITRIGDTTEFNTQKLLDGSKGAKTTSADLTGGVALKASATDKISIVDGSETKNNSFSLTYDPGTSGAITLNVEVAEGNYSNPVDLTVAINTAIKDAAAAYDKANGGNAATTAFDKLELGFNVETDSTSPDYKKVTFGFTNEDTTKTFSLNAADAGNKVASEALGFGSTPVTIAAGTATAPVTTSAGDFSATGTIDNKFDDFSVKLEDGLNQEVNQNNQLKLEMDGLELNAEIAEKDYSSLNGAGSLSEAVKTAINSAIDTAVGALSEDELNAKGYKGSAADMATAYKADLKANLEVSFNDEGKLEINNSFEMKVDETSKGAIATGMTNVNTDIKNSGISLQIGANSNQTMKIDISDMRAEAIGGTTFDGVEKFVSDIDVSTEEGAQQATDILDKAISQVSAERSKLGAYQNRLDHTINNLSTSSENLTAAESRVRDVDYALAA